MLRSCGHKLATAESCTGGWVAKAATDLAGSSDWFDRGLVTYSNNSKQQLLGVSEQTLEQNGAVSEQTIIEMVEGLFNFDGVSIGVAISGIAGPAGGSIDKPIGTVWIAWKSNTSTTITKCYSFKGDRLQVRLQAAIEAISGLSQLIKSEQ